MVKLRKRYGSDMKKTKLTAKELSGLHDFRLEALEKAKNILKSETISPMFFVELMMALPESKNSFMALSLCSDCSFYHAKEILAEIAGVVITKGYLNTPNLKEDSHDYTKKDWEWYNNCQKAGKEYISDIKIKEYGERMGLLVIGAKDGRQII